MTAIIGSVDFRDQIIPTGDDFPVTYGDSVDSEHVFVRVGMDDGTVGYGEGTALPWFTGESAPDMAAVIERWLEPRIRGKTVVDALVAFDEFTELFPGNPGAKAAVEMALLDLRAKRLNVRMADLLGMPRRDSVPVDFTIPGVDPETTAEIAGQEHKNGFTHIKVKATGDIEFDIARIDRVLETLPINVSVTVDANGGWSDAPTAIHVLDSLAAPRRIAAVEQPVPPGREASLREVWHESRIPVFADESAMDADDVERLSREQLVAGCHLKLAKVGGLRAALDAAQTANRHGLPVTVTNALGTSLDAAANLHLAAVIPSLSSACEVGANYLSEDPARPKLERKPTMAVPEGPGIGLELPDELFG